MHSLFIGISMNFKCILMVAIQSLLLSCNAVEATEVTGYIFLGDSRTVGMENAVNSEELKNVFFVAEVGKGYKWLVDTAEQEIADIKSENADITDWVVVSNLGVNDLGNVNEYNLEYNRLLSEEWEDDTLYLLSINPVDETKCKSVSNESIKQFNDSLSVKCYYLDSYDFIYKNMESSDGLHYSKSLNYSLFNKVLNKIMS